VISVPRVATVPLRVHVLPAATVLLHCYARHLANAQPAVTARLATAA
jgi:hypothetical protein